MRDKVSRPNAKLRVFILYFSGYYKVNRRIMLLVQLDSLFIYVLSSTASGQSQRQHDYKQQQWDNTGQNTQKNRKIDQLRLFIFQHELLKLSVHLQTAFAAETRLAEGPLLEEHVNVVNLRMFRAGTRMPTVRGLRDNI
jgi:hypothetical protein